jgi:hypothetical protein
MIGFMHPHQVEKEFGKFKAVQSFIYPDQMKKSQRLGILSSQKIEETWMQGVHLAFNSSYISCVFNISLG